VQFLVTCKWRCAVPHPSWVSPLTILLDDVGFGAASTFGGPCRTPTADRLAAGGLRYNRFHTTALCAPTRAALLSGRNHHSVGMGSITETATSAPGNTSLRPNTQAPLAMTLKLNGYSTAQFGKCHEVPVWQSSPMGPFDAWPSGGGGFEAFYGFIGGENNQYDPALYDGTTPVEPPATPEEGYHLTEDLADRAISWMRQQKALMPDKPVFMYFAPGATHAPHHVPRNGLTSTRVHSTTDGTCSGNVPSAGRRSLESSQRMPS
jgi:arylsulfatase A-like enzyme